VPGRLAGAALLTLLATGCGGVAPARTAADVTNPRLSPERSQWLVGPIAWLASNQEVEAYLALADDVAAEAFEETFWTARDPDPARPGNPVRELFGRRSQEADRRFTEAGYRGLRTDRGTLFVLHGEPLEIEYEISPVEDGPPIEVWRYAADAPVGLDGRQPAAIYRFVKVDDLTRLYRPRETEAGRGARPGLRP
jgi:GWxTD domain-containing protein